MKDEEHGTIAIRNSVIGAFIGTLVFIVLAATLFGWGTWWIYMIIGFIWIGTVSNVLRYYMVERVNCPSCGSPANKFDKFCKVCGHKFLNICPKCQRPVTIGAKFCEECGTELKQPEKVEPPIPSEEVKGAIINFCPGCGEKVENPSAKHCSYCGTALK